MKYILTLVCIVLISCIGNKKMKETEFSFDTQGHRGCRGLMPENTIPAMLKAIDLGVHTLEMDVVISKDQKVVVSHDPYFSHEITTKPNGDTIGEIEEKQFNLYKMNYDEIKLFDVGIKKHPRFPQQIKFNVVKPLLEELIDSVENYIVENKKAPIRYNIETKCLIETDSIFHPEPTIFSKLIMEVILRKGIADKTIIQSFDPRTLIYIHKHYPKQKVALLIDEGNSEPLEKQIEKLGFLPTIYSPHYTLITPILIEYCHKKGIQVIPWTINDLDKMRELKFLGIDGVISDYPNLYKNL